MVSTYDGASSHYIYMQLLHDIWHISEKLNSTTGLFIEIWEYFVYYNYNLWTFGKDKFIVNNYYTENKITRFEEYKF